MRDVELLVAKFVVYVVNCLPKICRSRQFVCLSEPEDGVDVFAAGEFFGRAAEPQDECGPAVKCQVNGAVELGVERRDNCAGVGHDTRTHRAALTRPFFMTGWANRVKWISGDRGAFSVSNR